VLTATTAKAVDLHRRRPRAERQEMKPTFPGLALTDLWETKGAPASNAGDADAADRPVHLEPPKDAPSSASSSSRPTARGRRTRTATAGFKAIGAATRRTSTRPTR